MTVKALTPSPVTFSVDPKLRVNKISKPDIPAEEFEPYRLNLFDAPSYRLRKGWPVQVSPYDVRSLSLVTATGEVLASRPGAYDVITGAAVRWIADSYSFSSDDLSWFPSYTEWGSVKWGTQPEYLPTLVEDYEYSRNNQRFVKDVVNFDSTSTEHMWCDLTTIAGAAGFSVIMVGTVNSVYGNTIGQSYTGILGNGIATPNAGSFAENINSPFELRLVGSSLKLFIDRVKKGELSIDDVMRGTDPFYIGLVLGRPKATLYVAQGSQNIRSLDINTGTSTSTFSTSLVLGRTYGNTLHTADMALMELGVYGAALSSSKMRSEIAKLARVYG